MKAILILVALLASAAYARVDNPLVFIGEVVKGGSPGAPLIESTSGQVANGLLSIGVSSTSNATTTSGTDSVMTTMTVTPAAGTYLVMFQGGIQQNIAGNFVSVSIYVGGVQDTSSVIRTAPFAGGTLTAGQASVPYSTHGVYTVNGSQAVAIEWSVSGGTGTVFTRRMTLLRIG